MYGGCVRGMAGGSCFGSGLMLQLIRSRISVAKSWVGGRHSVVVCGRECCVLFPIAKLA